MAAWQAGHEANDVECVRPNISQRARRTALRRIRAPYSLLLAGGFKRRAQPVLRVLDLDHSNGSELALCDHLPRLPHHRISGVIVGEPKYPSGAPHCLRQLLRLFESGGERFVADYMDSGFKEGFGDLVMRIVGSNDRHRIDFVFARRLCAGHFRITAVGAIGREMKLQPGLAAALRIGGERPSHQLEMIVEPGGNAMHSADKCARPAAHHAQPKAPVGLPGFFARIGTLFRLDRHSSFGDC